MARVRGITEMGMGVDVHGRDATKAAKRAVSDAIRHSSLGFFRMLGKTEVPAIVIEVSEPDCLVMSLVENIARRKPRPIDSVIDVLIDQFVQPIDRRSGLDSVHRSRPRDHSTSVSL